MTWIRFLRLLLSVVAEAVASLFHLILFPFRRRRLRSSVRNMMCRSGARPGGAIALGIALGLSVLFGAGCRNTFPGSSFGKQVDELRWSLAVIFDPELEESMESLKSDLRTLFDPELDQLPETIELLGW